MSNPKMIWELLGSQVDDLFDKHAEDDLSEFEKMEEEEYSLGGTLTKRIMPTPFGLAIVDESMNPFKNTQFLMFHTNFPITEKIFNIIEKTPGVETLKVLTQYRGVLSIGKIFDSTNVRRTIENQLCGNRIISNSKIKERFEQLQKDAKKHKKWSIYVLPNGIIDFTFLKDDESNKEEFSQICNIHKESVKLSNGVLLTNEI